MNKRKTTAQQKCRKVWHSPEFTVVEIDSNDIIATSNTVDLQKMENGDWAFDED